MTNFLRVAVAALTLTTACMAQEQLVTVSNKGKKVVSHEVDKIYLSACAAVQREFGNNDSVRPRITLVLGSDKDAVDFDKRQVLLVRWDPELFAQGVVVLAFEDLMPVKRRAAIAKRAMNWAGATIEVAEIGK